MRYFFFTFCLLFVFNVIGQDSLIVQYSIIDQKSGDAVPNVTVATTINGGDVLFRTSHQKGEVYIKCSAGSRIHSGFTHPIYQSGTKDFTAKRRNGDDTLKVEIFLTPEKVQLVGEVIVKPTGVPQVVFESKRLSVADFEIQPNGEMILLTYPKRLTKGSELLLYDGLHVQNSFQVPNVAEELVRDYRGNAHIICKDNVYGIFQNGNKIGIAQLEKDYFVKYILPIVDTNKTKMYFSTFDPNYPAMDYYSYDQLDSTYMKIMNIEDELMMELYRSEYKWMDVRTKLWAYNQELQTGVDKEIWIGANYFTKSIYYEEIYAPLFHRNDSLFLFDYYKDKLYTFDDLGNPIDSVSIYHHYQPKSTGWKKHLIQDKITGEIYARFEKHGYSYLGRIDTKTGEIGELVKLEYQYIDKLEVHGNHAFYVYRPYESIQKKYLYKERLPYSFDKAKVPQGNLTSTNTGK